MSNNFPDRSARLQKILKNTNISNKLALFYESPIQKNKQLKQECIEYVLHSLKIANPNKNFEYSDNILKEYEEDILNLPNKTPNGLILPKKDNMKQYEKLHQVIVDIFKDFKIEQFVKSIHFPINIRLVSGKKTSIDSRPRASSKLHSDIWAGEFSNTIMIFLAALGDIEGTGIEFLEPTQAFHPEFCKPLNDYSEGACLEETSEKYDCQMHDGHAYFTDPFLLHRTIKRSSNLRISIDFRFVSTETCPTDIEIHTDRHENYIPFEEWANIGKTNSIDTEQSIADSFAVNTTPQNAYPSKYSIRKTNAS